ncbi:hypothetical protein Cni_G22829 [Canna indica]|uniref:PUM-HD domain-containing protein n=1 Tax=Canna indica TaxID=4628 RepID=A0AAQ3KSI2_9LILI|nr:hypothetical protein Cni_G22829 [Canna indica]
MVTETPRTMLSDMGVRSVTGGSGDGYSGEDFENDLGLLLKEQRSQEARDRERELNIYRSGSAPPTVEGSLNSVGGVFGGMQDFLGTKNGNGFSTEEELLSNPAYLSYYYSNVNLNPRLPPPVLSKEDWRSTQRLQEGNSVLGGIGDGRKINNGEQVDGRSLFSKQPVLSSLEEAPGLGQWLAKENGLIGMSLGRQKSFADVVQDELKDPITSHQSQPASRNAFVNGLEPLSSTNAQFTFHKQNASLDGPRLGAYAQSDIGLENVGPSSSPSFASVVGSSIRRSTTPDAQLLARAPSPCHSHIGPRNSISDKRANSSSSFNGASPGIVESDNLIAAFSNVSLSNADPIAVGSTHSKLQQEYSSMQSIPNTSYPNSFENSGGHVELRNSGSGLNGLTGSQKSAVTSGNSYLKLKPPTASHVAAPGHSVPFYQNRDSGDVAFASSGLNTYPENPALSSTLINHVGFGNIPPLLETSTAASEISSLAGGIFAPPNLVARPDLQTLNSINNPNDAAYDPLYIQFLKTAEYTAQIAAKYGNPSLERGYAENSYTDLLGVQKAYIDSLLQPQKQYGMPLLGKSGTLNHSSYGNPVFGLGTSFSRSPLASSIASPLGPGSPLTLSDRNKHFSSNLRNLSGGVLGSWHANPAGIDEHFPISLLDEFKGNKTRCFELAEISGHVVEFSSDQYGSRFIQQKLETATTEEKKMVFDEIMPQALSLMTDVFGNYVIQKFFEHGSATQRRELANQLNGHVLALSLQMYGCRVIQKAIEVVDLDQKIKMVLELDGHVMRCVRDQNGNHVIQKCIECVPQDAIQFIISTFYNQVVTLSTHPYGCRVIQRVLEHCDDPKTQQIVMEEILQSVCMLAQDQYGNYVVQHVLEHGKPDERSVIIKKLTGQIVQMSQQKFASNVIEKCLTFGSLEERQHLVYEMLGSTDENEPLQAMMKDQFANYVVQKVLETCDDQQRELILSRIKVHLNALKKYTYGKHIVARVEKLVAAGERRSGLQPSYPS